MCDMEKQKLRQIEEKRRVNCDKVLSHFKHFMNEYPETLYWTRFEFQFSEDDVNHFTVCCTLNATPEAIFPHAPSSPEPIWHVLDQRLSKFANTLLQCVPHLMLESINKECSGSSATLILELRQPAMEGLH